MSLFDQVTSKLGAAFGGMGGEQAGLVGGALEMLSNEEGGGLAGLVEAFQAKGFGTLVSSWVSPSANLPISADQIQAALGAERVQQLAERTGVSPETVRAKLAEWLPMAVDKLTPDGKLPEGGALAQAMNLLKGPRS